MTSPTAPAALPRRDFLTGLVHLPLVGGSLALIGAPHACVEPVTEVLIQSYKSWLQIEHRALSLEMAGYDTLQADFLERSFLTGNAGWRWHFRPQAHGKRLAGWEDLPQPSTRAALVLSVAGCDWREGRS